MDNVTIRPILKLLSLSSRSHIKINDLRQVGERLENSCRRKQRNFESTLVEAKYLEIINHLIKSWTHKPIGYKIPKAEIVSKVDTYLRRAGFYFNEKKHRAATKNFFWNDTGAHHYDIAFYNPLSPAHRSPAHHQDGGQQAVFFMRAETHGDQILLGNLQIDDKHGDFWARPEVGKILLKTKNMDLNLVQHALRHAINSGHKEILFHAGDTMEAAQFKFSFPKKTLITKDNYEIYHRDYLNKLNILTQLARGDIIYENNNTCLLYYRATQDKHEFCLGKNLTEVVQELFLNELWLLPDGTRRIQELNKILQALPSKGREINFLSQVTQLLETLESNIELPAPEAQQAWAGENDLLQSAEYYPGKEWACVMNYLEFFDLTNVFLKNHPEIKKIEACAEIDGGESKTVYANLGKSVNKITITADRIPKPVIGQYHPNWFSTLQNRLPDLAQKFHPNYSLYNWYEFRLTKLFKTLGLKHEKIKISRTIKGKTENVWAYRITDGIEDFKSRPWSAFSTHGELKTDCVTLAQLFAAANKFGLSRQHLRIANEFINDSLGGKHTGIFDANSNEIRLANKSLSVFAHEGIHYLKAQGLIPHREYQALISAGKDLVRKDPELQKYINQRHRNGKEIYPPGPIRDDEFAALFAEAYFENNKIARSSLIDDKISNFSRIIEYIKNVLNIIKTNLGDDVSLACVFLRKISLGYDTNHKIQHRCPAAKPSKPLTRKPIIFSGLCLE